MSYIQYPTILLSELHQRKHFTTLIGQSPNSPPLSLTHDPNDALIGQSLDHLCELGVVDRDRRLLF